MKPTDTTSPNYYHKVVDCQWACPAHTPVPEYIRLIAAGRYTDAYMINWKSNVFPGILGRVCDRPCEPACRRGRVEKEPVAICRLKRVAADYKTDIVDRLPAIPAEKNGKRVALIGAGPASLTVARDLAPLGYELVVIDKETAGGGMMRTQIPSFRLPESVLDEEISYILNMGVEARFGVIVESMKTLVDDTSFDAIFVGTGAPRGRDLNIPGRHEADRHINIGIEWLESVSFGHTESIEERVVVLGGGNFAMDCCRTARRLGGKDVKVVVRSPFADMKASPWEKEDAIREDIPIIDNHVPKEFIHDNGKLTAILFEKVEAHYDEKGRRSLIPTGEPLVKIDCDRVLIAVGQENAFPWVEKDIGIDFDEYNMPIVDTTTFQSTLPKVFFGGDAAFGPKNIITAVAHGHEAALSIDLFCQAQDVNQRPAQNIHLSSQKMGIHDWSYDSQISEDLRFAVPHVEKQKALENASLEVELGFDEQLAFQEAQRCLNCDVQTVFSEPKCIECDACVDICPTDCINFFHLDEDKALRTQLRVPAKDDTQDVLLSDTLPTGKVMAKDEDVCLHCGLCAERCPTGAWDMQKFVIDLPVAGERG